MTSRAQAEDYLKKYEAINLYRQLGATLDFIGEKYGLSKERVRQILRKRERFLVFLENEPKESDEMMAADGSVIGDWLHAWGADNGITFNDQ